MQSQPPALFFSQRHYNEEDPEKEQRVKEIELLLMSTENELRGQPSLPVSCAFVCVCASFGVTIVELSSVTAQFMCMCV